MSSMNLPAIQGISLAANLRHETLIIPSTSQPNFGSYFIIDIKDKNIVLNGINLQFITSAISGTYTGTAVFNPCLNWFTRIEIVMNGQVIDTVYPSEQFLRNQLLMDDEDRVSTNIAMGRYDSTAQRTILTSTTTTNTFYMPLKTFIGEARPNLLTEQHQIQLRIYMDTLANNITSTTGTPVATILSCAAFCNVTRLDTNSAMMRYNDMMSSPYHTFIHDTRYATFSVPSGTLTTTIVLTPIVGNITALLFTVRATTVGVGAWNFTQLASWAINDAQSTNIVGGSALPASYCANILNRDWSKSSYNTETSFNSATNNAANYYMWSLSVDPVAAMLDGQALTSRRFIGAEQLILNFPTTTTTAVQVDVYAWVESVLEQGVGYVKKLSF